MRISRPLFTGLLLIMYAITVVAGPDAQQGNPADKPLFRDPIHDGAADPVVIWNRQTERWTMLYTNRRATAEHTPGVSWVHGTNIGMAESTDGGASWTYTGTASIDYGTGEVTYWAPEVIEHNGLYHMYLTYVPGIFTHWDADRDIVHLTSDDLYTWTYESVLPLSSDRVIDASVMQLPDGSWRMWYNNERDAKSIYFADSDDLYTWVDRGKAIGDQPGEGPHVFEWKDSYWMVVDVWDGLGVYRSDDCLTWTRQEENLLSEPGTGTDDRVKGGHPYVVVSEGRAFLFYFTHPGRRGENAEADTAEQRRSSIQVVELMHENSTLRCNRNETTWISLTPP